MQVIKGNVKRIEIYFEEQNEGRMKQILWVHKKMEPYQTIGGLYGSSKVKGEKEDNRDSVVTLVHLIAESGELFKLDIVFPDKKDRSESKNSD